MGNNNKINAKRQVVEEIHKPARINFPERKVVLKTLNDLFQIDLVDMKGYLKVINIFWWL